MSPLSWSRRLSSRRPLVSLSRLAPLSLAPLCTRLDLHHHTLQAVVELSRINTPSSLLLAVSPTSPRRLSLLSFRWSRPLLHQQQQQHHHYYHQVSMLSSAGLQGPHARLRWCQKQLREERGGAAPDPLGTPSSGAGAGGGGWVVRGDGLARGSASAELQEGCGRRCCSTFAAGGEPVFSLWSQS